MAGIASVLIAQFAAIGTTAEIYVLLITVLGCMLFVARNFQLALVLLFVFSSFEFMVFYTMSMAYQYALYVMLLSLVLMALSLLIAKEKIGSGIV